MLEQPIASPFHPSIPLDKLKVWVLSPKLISVDANIDYYYDFSQSIAEYTEVFNLLGIEWKWQDVTIQDYAFIIDNIVAEKLAGKHFPIVLNLCDGDEVNGTPGISVVELLDKNRLVYTGADAFFYEITTSKIPMKLAFDFADIATPKWEAINSVQEPLHNIFNKLGNPIIVKPAVSGGSMGVGIRNVVATQKLLENQVAQMFEGYRGWNLVVDGIILEAFIKGAEFTTLIIGDADYANSCKVFEPVERVFHSSLKETERFLSFDRLWEIYEEESPMPENENFYEYHAAPPQLIQAIKKITLDAYLAVGGKGYARVDIRMDAATGALYVLEVNAQCGLSADENYTSIGAILRVSETSFKDLIVSIINLAFCRNIALDPKSYLPV